MDESLARLLATPSVRWDELADLTDTLEELLRTTSIDHTRLAPV
ncbi:hypothetical protein [Streptomyces geranii]|nr:hypothetical protein [Streptomyces geranii]